MDLKFLPFLQAPAQGPPGGALAGMMPILLMFGIFYFLLIRPQQKRQKEHEAMVKNLAKNDEVVTNGGLHGTVVGLKESSVLLRIAENVRVELQRSAVSKVVKSRTEEPAQGTKG